MKIGRITVHASITDDRIVDAVGRGTYGLDSPGFCVLCGVDVEGVEPDARGYQCESCGAETGVYGAEELLVRIAI